MTNCCNNCNIFTKFVEPSGKIYDFCCNTCKDFKYDQNKIIVKDNSKPYYKWTAHGPQCNLIPCNITYIPQQKQAKNQPLKITHNNKQIDYPINLNRNLYNGNIIKEYNDYNVICFYHSDEPLYEFTNFFNSPIQATFNRQNIIFKTSEHMFQSLKFINSTNALSHITTIASKKTPKEAFEYVRQLNVQTDINPNWHGTKENTGYSVKDNAMRCALRCKFAQNGTLKNLLLSTKGRVLVEHTVNDNYWGDNGDGTGLNMLGKLLMELRDYYLSQGPYPSTWFGLNSIEFISVYLGKK